MSSSIDCSTVFKTPTKCSTFCPITPISNETPRKISGTTPRQHRIKVTPKSVPRTPGDRFIPSRAGADLQFSAYKVRSGRRCSRSNRKLENVRTPHTITDSDSAQRREKLFALRGRSSASRVLNIKQTSATPTKQNSGEFDLLLNWIVWFTSVFFWQIMHIGDNTVSLVLNQPHSRGLQGSTQRLLIRFWMLLIWLMTFVSWLVVLLVLSIYIYNAICYDSTRPECDGLEYTEYASHCTGRCGIYIEHWQWWQ